MNSTSDVKDLFGDEDESSDSTPPQKQVILGLIPKQNEYFMNLAWAFVKDEVQKIVESAGQETLVDVYQSIFFDRSFLYLAFEVEGEVSEDKFQEKLLECLTQKNSAKYVGFVILAMELHNVHIWQAHIEKEYQNTNVLQKAFGFVENEAKKLGSPSLSFATHRAGWDKMAGELGFSKISTLYKKPIM